MNRLIIISPWGVIFLLVAGFCLAIAITERDAGFFGFFVLFAFCLVWQDATRSPLQGRHTRKTGQFWFRREET